MAGWFDPPGGVATVVGERDRILIDQSGISRTVTALQFMEYVLTRAITALSPTVVVVPAEMPLTENVTTLLMDSIATAATYTGQNALRDLYRALVDDFHSQVNIRFIGDSITWGMTVAGSASTTPRTAQLTDARQNLTSLCMVNLVRGYLGASGGYGALIAGDPGSGSYERVVTIPPDDPRITSSRANGTVTTKTLGFNAYNVLGSHIDLNNSGVSPEGIEFDFYGDALTVIYNQAASFGSYRLICDSEEVGVYTTAGDTEFNITRDHVLPSLGWHTIRIENAQLISANIRLTGVRWTKSIRVANDGIIGVPSSYWLPGTPLLDGAIQADDEFVFIMIGTNDRGVTTSGPFSPVRSINNVKITADHLRDTHGKKCIIMCAGAVTEDESVKKFTMASLSRCYKQCCYDMGYDLIDHFTPTNVLLAKGIAILADGLHPNDVGHAVMASTIIRAIEGAR